MEDFVKKEFGKLSVWLFSSFFSSFSLHANKLLAFFQELRKKFQKQSDEFDSSLSRYVAKKPKDTNWHEVPHKKSCFNSAGSFRFFLNTITAQFSRLLSMWLMPKKFFITVHSITPWKWMKFKPKRNLSSWKGYFHFMIIFFFLTYLHGLLVSQKLKFIVEFD